MRIAFILLLAVSVTASADNFDSPPPRQAPAGVVFGVITGETVTEGYECVVAAWTEHLFRAFIYVPISYQNAIAYLTLENDGKTVVATRLSGRVLSGNMYLYEIDFDRSLSRHASVYFFKTIDNVEYTAAVRLDTFDIVERETVRKKHGYFFEYPKPPLSQRRQGLIPRRR